MLFHTASQQGRGNPIPGAQPLGQFGVTKMCASTALTITTEGIAILESKESKGFVSVKDTQYSTLRDLSYTRYTEAGPLAALAGNGINQLEVFIMGEKYHLHTPLPLAQLESANAAILAGALGRAPSAPIKTVIGSGGRAKLEIGPEFTSVHISKPSLCAMLATKEVTTVRTADVSHLRVTLPSWQNALIRAIRDVELFKIVALINSLMMEDLVMLPVWPCSFFNHFYVTLVLLFKAIASIMAFLIIFFCRKTALILGGPGPGKQINFPIEEKPEEMLRMYAADFAAISGAGAGSSKEVFIVPIIQPASVQMQRAVPMKEVEEMSVPQPAQAKRAPPRSKRNLHVAVAPTSDLPNGWKCLPDGSFESPNGNTHATLPKSLAQLTQGLPPGGWEVDFEGDEAYFISPSGDVSWDKPHA